MSTKRSKSTGCGAGEASGSAAVRGASGIDAGDDRDSQFQISGGYTFEIGVTAEIGWKASNETNVETQTLGAKLSYAIPF